LLAEGGKTPQTSSGQQQADVSGLAAKVDALSADVAEIKALLQRLAAQGPEISVAEQ
jgi:outer membrane murein-binding lipoprotein Lpp